MNLAEMRKAELLEECIQRGFEIASLKEEIREIKARVVPIKPRSVDDGFSSTPGAYDDGVTYYVKTITGDIVKAMWAGCPKSGCWIDANKFVEIDHPVAFKPTGTTDKELKRLGLS